MALHALQECTVSMLLTLGPLNMVRRVKLLCLLWIRTPQQLAFCSQLRKKKAMLRSQLLLEYSAIILSSTALHIECIAQMVRQNCPGIANRVQFSWTLLHEAVTVRSIDP